MGNLVPSEDGARARHPDVWPNGELDRGTLGMHSVVPGSGSPRGSDDLDERLDVKTNARDVNNSGLDQTSWPFVRRTVRRRSKQVGEAFEAATSESTN